MAGKLDICTPETMFWLQCKAVGYCVRLLQLNIVPKMYPPPTFKVLNCKNIFLGHSFVLPPFPPFFNFHFSSWSVYFLWFPCPPTTFNLLPVLIPTILHVLTKYIFLFHFLLAKHLGSCEVLGNLLLSRFVCVYVFPPMGRVLGEKELDKIQFNSWIEPFWSAFTPLYSASRQQGQESHVFRSRTVCLKFLSFSDTSLIIQPDRYF